MRMMKTSRQETQLNSKQQEALEEMRQRAESGDLQCMYQLASYYYNGEYVGYSPEKACYWWTEAANRGHVDSMYNLGLLYGGGVSAFYRNDNLAGYWLDLAAQNGDQEAAKELRKYKHNIFGNWVKRR